MSERIPFLMVALPLIGAAFGFLTAGLGREHARRSALINVIVTLGLAVWMVAHYDPDRLDAQGQPQLIQMGTSLPWVGTVQPQTLGAGPREDELDGQRGVGPDIEFALAVDGLSLWLIGLSALLMIPAVLVSWEAITDRAPAFYALMLMLEAGLIGVFAAQDIILFYIFFEFTLVPLFFMIGIWGGHDRRWAARKFFIYTLAGSVLTFLGLLAIVLSHSWLSGTAELTFSIPRLTNEMTALVAADPQAQSYWAAVSPWIFLALFAGFAIKVPLFPFHTWLPLAHVEAPTAGSVLLAGVLLKIGTYGFLRFALPLVPDGCFEYFHWVAMLAVVGVIYGALLALAQDDIKKLVAYSSVSHMGFCILGLFAFNAIGITGGLLQMVNHGLSTGALFAMVGMLYERYHTRDIASYQGMARKYPVMAFFLMLIVFSSIGLPGLNGFTGEIMSLMGMFRAGDEYAPWYAVAALSGIILGAWYMLWLVQRTFFGPLREPVLESPHGAHAHAEHAALKDLNTRELCALVPVVVLIVWIGVYPQFFIRRLEPSVQQVVRYVAGETALASGGANRIRTFAGRRPPAASTLAAVNAADHSAGSNEEQIDNEESE